MRPGPSCSDPTEPLGMLPTTFLRPSRLADPSSSSRQVLVMHITSTTFVPLSILWVEGNALGHFHARSSRHRSSTVHALTRLQCAKLNLVFVGE